MSPTNYRYELRKGDAIIATGHITYKTPLEVGDEIAIGKTRGTVRELGPIRDGQVRLVIQIEPPA